MTTQTMSFLEAIEHLPAGGSLILTDVSWNEYEQLLTELGDCRGVRVTFDRGRLEVMSPSLNHEMHKDLIDL